MRAKKQSAAGLDAADLAMADGLDNLDGAENYAHWIVDLLAPHLGGRILELGAGHGTFSERLAEYGQLTVVEPSRRAFDVLSTRLSERPDIVRVHGTSEGLLSEEPFDAIVLINVLEHIEDDRGELTSLRGRLAPGGRLCIFVPAFPILYSRFDAGIGHFRRYRRPDLRAAAEQAGLQVMDLRYINSAGFFAWLISVRLLGVTPKNGVAVKLYDKAVVPVLRAIESRRTPPFGQSLICVARSTN